MDSSKSVHVGKWGSTNQTAVHLKRVAFIKCTIIQLFQTAGTQTLPAPISLSQVTVQETAQGQLAAQKATL